MQPATACSHRMVLLVRKRTHGGMGRFWRAFFASFFLMAKRFWDGCSAGTKSGARSMLVICAHHRRSQAG